ncbi:MAG: hypothetical protein WB014_08445 [Methanosarcina sp.]
MAVNRNSVHSVTTQYQDVACETSLRCHLKKLNMDELIKWNENILLHELMKILKKGKSYEFAADYTNDPYYGKIDPSNEKICNTLTGQKVNKFFLLIHLLYITNKNERFTVSVLPVEMKKTKVEYLSILSTSSKD